MVSFDPRPGKMVMKKLLTPQSEDLRYYMISGL